ncbi:MAG TPA: DNA-formamidopyrimidine glycosylase family protein, partial [Polyangiaceae bacterium]|nr:DNA-formamidopyrimidine glycosylase family protein [Polyangiaceae bacterium]
MPELPEVEVTRRQIGKVLLDREIESVTTTAPSYFFITPPRELERRLLGRRVRELARVGKYLVATLDDGSSLLLHLGMTGQLFASGASSL